LPAERKFEMRDLTGGLAFVAWDRLLDTARTGPMYLGQPEVALLVREQLHQLAGDGWFTLDAWVIMPNHVHVLWTPQVPLADLLRRVKGPTALRANRLLGTCGPFWQEEYFDRMVRDEREFRNVVRYIERNPVKEGLAASPQDSVWSSAGRG